MSLKSEKILIIRFSSIGDIVLTSAVVRCIKKQLPKSEIYFLTKKQFENIVAFNPNIYKVICFNNSLPNTISELKEIGFDYIIDLHNNLRSRLVTAVFPFTKVFRFNKLNAEKWLLTNFKIDRLPQKHIVDRYFDAIKPLNIINDEVGLDFFIAEKDTFNINTLSENFKTGYIVFSIGGQHETKKMPIYKWQQLAVANQYPTIILGGKEEFEVGEQISQSSSYILNLCGKTSLAESASVMQQCKAVITHDTGLMHIAAAFKKPIVSIWGNTVPVFGMYPYYGKYIIPNFQAEVKNLDCRPCSKLGHKKCPEGHFKCMENQDIAIIILFLKENLLPEFPVI